MATVCILGAMRASWNSSPLAHLQLLSSQRPVLPTINLCALFNLAKWLPAHALPAYSCLTNTLTSLLVPVSVASLFRLSEALLAVVRALLLVVVLEFITQALFLVSDLCNKY